MHTRGDKARIQREEKARRGIGGDVVGKNKYNAGARTQRGCAHIRTYMRGHQI